MKTIYFVTGPPVCQRHDPESIVGHICRDCLLEIVTKKEIRSLKSIMTEGPINHWVITESGSSFQPAPMNL